MERMASFWLAARAAFFIVTVRCLESKWTLMCFEVAAHQMRRSPRGVSLQVSVSS
jgi:hypothetical protein